MNWLDVGGQRSRSLWTPSIPVMSEQTQPLRGQMLLKSWFTCRRTAAMRLYQFVLNLIILSRSLHLFRTDRSISPVGHGHSHQSMLVGFNQLRAFFACVCMCERDLGLGDKKNTWHHCITSPLVFLCFSSSPLHNLTGSDETSFFWSNEKD